MATKESLIGKTIVAIEYGDNDENFELSMNPLYLSSSCSDTESESKCDSHAEIGEVSNHLLVLELVDKEDWTKVLECVEQNKRCVKMTLLASSTSATTGNLLLHHVCKKNAPADVVEYVLKANKKAVSTAGENGFLPLHFACAAGAPISVIEILVDAYPGAVKVRENKKSRLPLHLATRGDGKASAEVIALLMSYFPEATMAGDSNGLRPLDYAANTSQNSKKTRWEIISVLEMGQKWIRVGQNVTQRLEQDFAERLRALEKDLGGYVESLKAVHDEEIARIANDILDVELDAEILVDGDTIDIIFEGKIDQLVEKHDRLLSLQEESRTQRLELQDKNYTVQEFDNESDSAIEEKQAQGGELSTTKREEELLARIHALEKSARLKTGVIKKIVYMAKEKEEKSQKNIVDLVTVINEQQAHIDMLMGKLDLCEEQLHVLKENLQHSPAIPVEHGTH